MTRIILLKSSQVTLGFKPSPNTSIYTQGEKTMTPDYTPIALGIAIILACSYPLWILLKSRRHTHRTDLLAVYEYVPCKEEGFHTTVELFVCKSCQEVLPFGNNIQLASHPWLRGLRSDLVRQGYKISAIPNPDTITGDALSLMH